MSCANPRLPPVCEGSKRGQDPERDQRGGEVPARGHLPYHKGAHRPEPDHHEDPPDPQQERAGELGTPGTDQPEEPAEHTERPHPGARDGNRGGHRRPPLLGLRSGPGAAQLRPGPLHLGLHQGGVQPAPGDQVCVTPLLDDPSAVQDDYPVGSHDAREPVCHHQRGAVFHQQVERLLYRRPRSPRPRSRAPRPGPVWERPLGAPSLSLCAGAARRTALRRARLSRCRIRPEAPL